MKPRAFIQIILKPKNGIGFRHPLSMLLLHVKNTLQISIKELENLSSVQRLKYSTPITVDKWKPISGYFHHP